MEERKTNQSQDQDIIYNDLANSEQPTGVIHDISELHLNIPASNSRRIPTGHTGRLSTPPMRKRQGDKK